MARAHRQLPTANSLFGSLFAILSLALSAAALEPSIQIKGPASAALGEPLTLEATAWLPAGMSLELDRGSSTAAFALSAPSETASEPAGDGTLVKFSVAVVPLDLGPQTLTLLWQAGSAPGGPPAKARLIKTTLALNVLEPPQAGGGQGQPDLRDIKPPLTAKAALWPWLAAALAAAGLYWALTRRRMVQAAKETLLARDERPAEAIAESELALLESSGLWAQRRHKEFYIRLTDIVRDYLERRFAIPATSLTTSELHRHLRHNELERELTQLFKSLFDRADLVKFAKTLPEDAWGAWDLSAARELVRRTTRRDLTASAAASAGRL